MTSKLKALVFDFDGVILESANVKTEAFCDLYAEHGPDVVARVREYHLANLGISRFIKFEWISQNVFQTPLSPAMKSTLGEKFSSLALSRVLVSPFVPGAKEALDALAGRYEMFVASGTPQEELDMIVDRRGLRALFQEVHGTPRDKPTILNDLMARKGLTADEILFIGDGLSDHDAAVATSVGFLARDTPEFHDKWVRLGVRREPDLARLPSLVAAWS
jgi:phosphoglycolate phosphatase-like HAD superfamily hydrolase